jgi:hypothetical protein
MPRRFLQGVLVLSLTAASAAGCSNGSATPVTPTSSATPINEPPFTGTLSLNGSVITQFTTNAAGAVTATIATLDPEPANPTGIALDLGTWNGVSCALQIETPNAAVGSTTTGSVAGQGTLCVRIADGAGLLTGPIAFTVNIVHF